MRSAHDESLDVSVIIVSYNTRALTLDCIRSIDRETSGLKYEIIVVDNSSSDGSADAIAVEAPQVHLVRLEENRGFACANNVGLRLARGEYLLLLNPDTLILDAAVERAHAFAVRTPRAAVVGCRASNADGSLQRNCFLPPSLLNLSITTFGLHRLAPRSRLFGRERFTYWDLDDARDVPVVAGCFMLVRRSAVSQVGLFDERFFMYAEEVDWCTRFRRAGWEVWYTPDPTIVHFGGASAATAPSDMRLTAQTSLLLYLGKYHPSWYVGLCRALILLGLCIRAPLQVLGIGAGRSENGVRDRLGEMCKRAALCLRGAA